MINKLLRALSNRNQPFMTPAFAVSDPAFAPAILPVDLKSLRALMLLDVTTTDYYLKAYLAALNAYPDIQALANDPVVSYRMENFPPRGVSISGGDLFSSLDDPGAYLDNEAPTLPVALTYVIDYNSPAVVKISALETGKTSFPPFTLSGSPTPRTLRVHWPPGIPFTGLITLDQDWVEGARIEIQVTPSRFPFELITQRIRGNSWLVNTLAQHQAVDEYVATQDSQRKVALACLMIALSNPSVYG